MPKPSKEARKRKRWDKYLRMLYKLNRGMYVDCNGRMYFKGLPEKQHGLTRNYHQRLKNRRRR